MIAPRFIVSLALAALAPVAADAQFTTFVSPPQRVDTVVVVDTVARTADSASASIANMKAWVDSAAGDAVDLSAVDTAATPVATDRRDVFGDGLPAPDTATPLPMILTVGAGAIAAGAFLLRRR